MLTGNGVRCKAHTSAGDPCKNWAVNGATTCRFHGAAASQVKRKAALRMAAREFAHEFGDQVVEPVDNPLEAFRRLTAEVLAFKDWISGRVSELKALRFTDAKQAEQLRSEVTLYERALDRSGHFLESWVRLGLDERTVKLNEEQAQLISGVIRAVFLSPRLNLSSEQQTKAWLVAAEELRLLDGGDVRPRVVEMAPQLPEFKPAAPTLTEADSAAVEKAPDASDEGAYQTGAKLTSGQVAKLDDPEPESEPTVSAQEATEGQDTAPVPSGPQTGSQPVPGPSPWSVIPGGLNDGWATQEYRDGRPVRRSGGD